MKVGLPQRAVPRIACLPTLPGMSLSFWIIGSLGAETRGETEWVKAGGPYRLLISSAIKVPSMAPAKTSNGVWPSSSFNFSRCV